MFSSTPYESPAAPASFQTSTTFRKSTDAPRITGHDAVLNSIRKDGRNITVVKSDGTSITGRVIAADKFTISVDDGTNVRVVFKHAIDEFFAQRRK